MYRPFLITLVGAFISASAHAALPTDCVQSQYPARVIPSCTDLIRQTPDNAVAYTKRGKAYADTGDILSAIADLTKAIEIDPNNADAWKLRGIAWRVSRAGKDLARAIADESRAIEINPAFARAYVSRGLAYVQQGDRDRALADYDKAIEIDPSYGSPYLYRALTRDLKDDPDRSIADFKRAFELDSRGWDNVVIDVKTGVPQSQAMTLINMAIERNAKDAVAYYLRGVMKHKSGVMAGSAPERALADLDKAIELDPAYAAAYVARGQAYSESKDDDPRALADFNKAIELDPNFARAYVARSIYYMSVASGPDQKDAALADLNKAIALAPLDGEAYSKRLLLYYFAGKHDLAKADLAKLVDINWTLAVAFNFETPGKTRYLDDIEAERQAKAQ